MRGSGVAACGAGTDDEIVCVVMLGSRREDGEDGASPWNRIRQKMTASSNAESSLKKFG